MTRLLALTALTALGALLAAGIKVAAPAHAMPLDAVIAAIRESGGHYQSGGASLRGSDCSGLVSVAQSLAMGQPIRRLGSTHTLLAGSWPHVIRGAQPSDRFVIGSSRGHMVAAIDGVAIESRTSGESYRVGAQARSPFEMPTVWHVDEKVLAI